MVYNRCVGTRYCSNNCPYKVRRFNFLDYRGELAPTEKMLMNPDVTVRTRGVMEKCTYCVQRIERVRIDARIEGRAIRRRRAHDRPASRPARPQAIVFGDLNDPRLRGLAAARRPAPLRPAARAGHPAAHRLPRPRQATPTPS